VLSGALVAVGVVGLWIFRRRLSGT
jgi:hypothetical protein